MNAFTKLVEHSKKVANFGHLLEIVGWDQAAVMPSGGAECLRARHDVGFVRYTVF